MPFAARLKTAARAAVLKAGFEVTRHPRTQSHAGLIVEILRRLEVDAVVDVGANAGQFGRFLRLIGYRGPIVSVEPLDEPFAVLEHTARSSPPWSAHQLALGATPGEQDIHVSSESQLSSLLPPNSSYERLVLTDTSTTRRSTPVDTLDALARRDPTLRGARRIFLKSDTQGYDAEVLRGAAEVLPRVVALHVELAVRPIYEGAPDWRTFLDDLRATGFELAGVFPVNTDRDLRLIDVDGVLVRSEPK